MVKTGHKKFVKKEKARVKLRKSYKTILPKGQNVTNTEFKVKRIVIREQLKERGENELLSVQRKLSVKELMSRLRHNNSAVKQDGLSGLLEIITLNPTSVIKSHFSSILDSVSPLMLDISATTRKAAVKLLSAMFSQVTEEELAPLFEIVVRYLACAMSHLDAGVREDSLLIIDVLLEQCPILTANYRSLLPHFLDMISSQTRSHEQARQLIVDLDSRTTTTVFRIKVLTRLRSMLLAIVHLFKTKSSSSNVSREIVVTSSTRHVPLYCSQQPGKSFIYDKKITSNETLDDVQNYNQMLMPLLMETFIEVVADRKQAGSDIVVEAVALLQCVVDIILNVLHILQQSGTGGVSWFKQTYARSIREHLYKGRFPYTVGSWGSTPNKNAKQRRKDSEAALKLLDSSLDLHCTGQNLSLCLLAFQLNIDTPVTLDYVLTSIKCSRSLKPTILACLDALVSKRDLRQCITVTETLLSLAKDPDLKFVVFPYLYNIVIRVDVNKLAKKTRIEDWLDTLPTYLCQKQAIPRSVVNSIMTLAARKIPALQNSIDNCLPELEISDCQGNTDEVLSVKKSLARLIYWVQDWDEELSEEICVALRKQHFGPLTPDVQDLWFLRNEVYEKSLA
ncbi:hypothetical protein M8J76_012318 [Diaphorina citri]|nr:hypothetical protein M8J76_012318 [Diaphorina citri]